jgi:hypothetical protein
MDPTTSATIIEVVKIVGRALEVVGPVVVTGAVALWQGRRQAVETARLRGKELYFQVNREEMLEAKERLRVIRTGVTELLGLIPSENLAIDDLQQITGELDKTRLSLKRTIPDDEALKQGVLQGRFERSDLVKFIAIEKELEAAYPLRTATDLREAVISLASIAGRIERVKQEAQNRLGLQLFEEYGILPDRLSKKRMRDTLARLQKS